MLPLDPQAGLLRLRIGMIAGRRDEVLVAFLDQGDRTAVPQDLGGQMGHLLEDHVEIQGRIEQLGGAIQEGRLRSRRAASSYRRAFSRVTPTWWKKLRS